MYGGGLAELVERLPDRVCEIHISRNTGLSGRGVARG